MLGYQDLHKQGKLQERIDAGVSLLKNCEVCPRRCNVDRTQGERGICRTGRKARIASYHLHFGEEEPLVGTQGSGTIFFAGCNLCCVFCQNFDISRPDGNSDDEEATPEQLALVMLHLQEQGALNINFVSPSHVVPQILESLPYAVEQGLNIPLVYNSGGYDLPEALRLLDGMIDIYMPDIKFFSPEPAKAYCSAPDYPETARLAVKEMHKQVGDLVLDEDGIAESGLLVRHLVMPEDAAGTEDWMRFLADSISKDTYVNIMDQYRPCGEAHKHTELSRRTTPQEYEAALYAAQKAGIHRLDQRHTRAARHLLQALRYFST